MEWILDNIWIIAFGVWGLPLSYYRSKFRKMVYQTDDWKINIHPKFWKELKALFGDLFPGNLEYMRLRNFYRFYLAIYAILFLLWRIYA